MKEKVSITRVRLQKGKHLVKRGGISRLETWVRGMREPRSLGKGELPEATRCAAGGGE